MHKNCLMGQKLCAFYQKCGAFWVKKIVRFFVLFLAKVGAPLSSKLLKTLTTIRLRDQQQRQSSVFDFDLEVGDFAWKVWTFGQFENNILISNHMKSRRWF